MSISNTRWFVCLSRTILKKKKHPLPKFCSFPSPPSFVHCVLLTAFCCLGSSLTVLFIPTDNFCPLYHCFLFLSSRRHVTPARCHIQNTSFRSFSWRFPVCCFLPPHCIFRNPFTVPGLTPDYHRRPGVSLTTGGWLWCILTTEDPDRSFQKLFPIPPDSPRTWRESPELLWWDWRNTYVFR